jgi:hypothetical protein
MSLAKLLQRLCDLVEGSISQQSANLGEAAPTIDEREDLPVQTGPYLERRPLLAEQRRSRAGSEGREDNSRWQDARLIASIHDPAETNASIRQAAPVLPARWPNVGSCSSPYPYIPPCQALSYAPAIPPLAKRCVDHRSGRRRRSESFSPSVHRRFATNYLPAVRAGSG